MTRLLLVRHGESEWNAAGRWQGWGDPPLTDLGRQQAARAAEALAGSVDHVATSDLARARQTADILASALGIGDVDVDPDLRELDVGEWTGLTNDELVERFPDEIARWRNGPRTAPPRGEHYDAFGERIARGLGRLAAAHPRGSVVVVAHGGVIGRLERDLDCHPGRAPSHLEARWFEIASELRVASDRVDLLAQPS